MKPRDIEKKVRSEVCVDVTPQGKVVYSMVEKESNLGLTNNDRFLLLNCRDGILCYYKGIPKATYPMDSIDQLHKPDAKNSIGFKEITYERPKDGTKNRLKVTLPPDAKGKPRTWLFIMNSKLVDRWVEELDHYRDYPLDQAPAKKPEEKPESSGEVPKPPGTQQQPPSTIVAPTNTSSPYQQLPNQYTPPKPPQQPSGSSQYQPPQQPPVGSQYQPPQQQPPTSQQQPPPQQPPPSQYGGSKVEPPAASNVRQPPQASNYQPPQQNSSQPPAQPSSYQPPQQSSYQPPQQNSYQPPQQSSYQPPQQSNYPVPQQSSYPPPQTPKQNTGQPLNSSNVQPNPATLPSSRQQPLFPSREDTKPSPTPKYTMQQSGRGGYDDSVIPSRAPQLAQTPMSQPRNYVAEPPDSIRSNEMYVREQEQQQQFRYAQPDNPSKFPYRVQPDPYRPQEQPIPSNAFAKQPPSQIPNTGQQQRPSDPYTALPSSKPNEPLAYNPQYVPPEQPKDIQGQARDNLSRAIQNETKYFPSSRVQQAEVYSQQPQGMKEPVLPNNQPVQPSPYAEQPQIMNPRASNRNILPENRPIFAASENPQYQQHNPSQPPAGHQQAVAYQAPHQSVPHQTVPHQTVPHQTTPHQPVPHNKIKTQVLYPQEQSINDIREPIKFIKPEGGQTDWNSEFNRPNIDQSEVIRSFSLKCEELIRKIVNDMTSKHKIYQSVSRLANLESYLVEGISVKMAYYDVIETRQGIVRYGDQQVRALRNEFRNYNYLLNVTANQADIRVPLTCMMEYRGVVALAKAEVDSEGEIAVGQLIKELSRLEKMTKLNRSVFTHGAVFKRSAITGLIFVDELQHLLPIDSWQGTRPFRGEIIHTSQTLLPGDPVKTDQSRDRSAQKALSELQQLHQRNRESADNLVTSLEDLTTLVLNSHDVKQELVKAGLTTDYLPMLLDSCRVELFRKYFASEIAAKAGKMLYRCHLQSNISDIKHNRTQVRDSEVQQYLLEEAHQLLNDLVARSSNSARLWKIISAEVFDKHQLNIGINDIHIGYFLNALFGKVGLEFNFSFFDRQRKFFDETDAIDRRVVKGFKARVWQYDYSYVERYRKVNELVQEEPSAEGLDTFVDLLNLSEQRLPQDMKRYQEVTLYLANFIPPSEFLQKEFTHLELYGDMLREPPDVFAIKLALMACKWAVKMKKNELSLQLFERASDSVVFWGGEFHPLLSQFYDFYTEVYIAAGDYDEGITLARSSFVNTLKIVGGNSLPISEKYFQMANCYFKGGKKQDALTNYLKTKEVLEANKRNNTPEYGLVLQKLGVLELNFGRVAQAIEYGLSSLSIFERDPTAQSQFIDAMELLSRSFEITQKTDRIIELSTLCSEKLKLCQDPKTMERMLKVALHPQLSDLPQQAVRNLLFLSEELSQNRSSSSYSKAFNYLYRRSQQQNIIEMLMAYIQRLQRLMPEITRNDLLRKYKGFEAEARTDAQDMLALLDAVLCLTDDSYIIGILREYEY